MQIIILIVLLSLLIWVMPKKSIKGYLFVSVVVLSGLFFFFWPDNGYDLYRYYLMMVHYNKLSFLQAIGLQANSLGNTLMEMTVTGYVAVYKLYSVIAWLLSKIGVYQFLAVFTCFVVYGLMMKQISHLFQNEKMKLRTVRICYVFVFLSYNYIYLSLVRQTIVFAIFGFVLYFDLVQNYRKERCFAVYLLLCMIHSTAILLLGFRLLILVSNKLTMILIAIGLSSIYMFIPWMVHLTSKIYIPVFTEFLLKMSHYLVDRAVVENQHVSTKATLMYVYLFLILLYFMRYSAKKILYRKYLHYILLLFLLCLVMLRQADVYNRMQLFFPILFIPIIMELVEEFSGRHVLSIKKKYTNCQLFFGLALLFTGMIVVLVYFVGTCNDSYVPSQQFYQWSNFMKNGDMSLPASR